MNQLLVAVAGILVVLTPTLRAWVQARLGPQKVATVHQVAALAVNAAEKLATNVPGTTGQQKLDFASSFLSDVAKRVGVKLSQDEILGFVHSALADLDAVQAMGSRGF